MFKTMTKIFMTSVIFFIAANAIAQDPGFPKARWWTESNVVNKLNLNDNEVEQIEKANADWRMHRGLLKSEIQVGQQEINSWKARKSSNPQGKERIIRKLEDKIEKARSSLPKLKPAYINKVRTIIGPARFEKLLSLKP
jgi:protein involved in sex pheromone biosynthesis